MLLCVSTFREGPPLEPPTLASTHSFQGCTSMHLKRIQTIFPFYNLICCSRPNRKGRKVAWLSPPPEIGAVLGPGKGPRSKSQVTWVSVLVQPRSHLSPSHLGSDSVGRRDPIMSWLRAQALAPDTVGSVQASPSFISHVAEPL